MRSIEPTNLRWAIEGMAKLDWANRMIGETYCAFPDGDGIREMLDKLQDARDLVKEVHKHLVTYARKRLEKLEKGRNDENQSHSDH